jgi:hypothetical protein
LKNIFFITVMMVVDGRMGAGAVDLIPALRQHAVGIAIQLVKVYGYWAKDEIIQIRYGNGVLHDYFL